MRRTIRAILKVIFGICCKDFFTSGSAYFFFCNRCTSLLSVNNRFWDVLYVEQHILEHVKRLDLYWQLFCRLSYLALYELLIKRKANITADWRDVINKNVPKKRPWYLVLFLKISIKYVVPCPRYMYFSLKKNGKRKKMS